MNDTPNHYWNFMSKIIIKYFHKLVLNCGNILYLAIVYEIVLIKSDYLWYIHSMDFNLEV